MTSWPYIQIQFILFNERLNVKLLLPRCSSFFGWVCSVDAIAHQKVSGLPRCQVFNPNSGFKFASFQVVRILTFQVFESSSFQVFKFPDFQRRGSCSSSFFSCLASSPLSRHPSHPPPPPLLLLIIIWRRRRGMATEKEESDEDDEEEKEDGEEEEEIEERRGRRKRRGRRV